MANFHMFRGPEGTWGVALGDRVLLEGESYQVAANVQEALERGDSGEAGECAEVAQAILQRVWAGLEEPCLCGEVGEHECVCQSDEGQDLREAEEAR